MKNFLKNYWVFLIPLLALIITGIFLLSQKRKPHIDKVPIVGMVEADFVDVSSTYPGRLIDVYVKTNQEVKKGEIVAEIKADQISNISEQMESVVRVMENRQSLVHEGFSPEMVQSAANLQSIAEEQMDLMTKTYDRFLALYDAGVISGEEKDVIYFKYKAAEKELETAKLNAQRIREGLRQQVKNISDELVDQAKDAQKITEEIKEDSKIKAPADGIINTVISKEGEMVNAGYPIMTIQKSNSLHINFNIRQDHMTQIKEGQRLQVRVPGAEPEVFETVVTEMAAALGYADWIPDNQKGDFELRTFKIKCVPVNPEAVKGLRPGMTAGLILD